MPTTHHPEPAPRILIGMTVASVLAMIAAWLVVVLDYQYQVTRLSPFVLLSDELFLVGLLGVLVTLCVWRWGFVRVRSVALRLAFSATVVAAALVGGEIAARRVLSNDLYTFSNPAPCDAQQPRL